MEKFTLIFPHDVINIGISYSIAITSFRHLNFRCITSLGVQHLEIHQSSLLELDLSGCYRIDGETLTTFVRECTKLKPQKVN